MKKYLLALSLSVCVPFAAHADIPVIDASALAKLDQISKTTDDILQQDKDIKTNTDKILEAITGQRQANLGMSNSGAAGGMSVAKAPSLGSVLNGGAMSFGGLGDNVKQLASLVINGMKLVKEIKTMIDGQSTDTGVNTVYQNGVNTSSLVTALVDQASQGVTARQSTIEGVAGKIGQAQDMKGAVDENSRLQAETITTTNELIGVQNAATQTLNQKLQMDLLSLSATTKIGKKDNFDPFAGLVK